MGKNNWLIADDPHPELSPDHPSGMGACIGAANAFAIVIITAGIVYAGWQLVIWVFS